MKLANDRTLLTLGVLLLLTALIQRAMAQCDDWRSGPARNNQALNGADGVVYSLTSWDPTGSAPMLVAGGHFTRMQDATVQNLALLDAVTGQWGPLGTLLSFPAQVNAITVFNGMLVAGSGTSELDEGTARYWDGTGWRIMDSGSCMLPALLNMTPMYIKSFGTYQGALIGGGNFTGWLRDTGSNCEGQFGWGLSQWDGSNHWFRPSDAFWAGADVLALTQFNSQLIVGGHFGPDCSCEPGEYIAAWDGANWSDMAGGLNNQVQALTVFQGQLYAGGAFTQTAFSGITLNHIARWDGSAWHVLGSGLNGTVTSLTVFQNNLIVGGSFTLSGALSLNHIARWDGSVWHALGNGMDNTVECLTNWNNALIAGGDFSVADAQPANHIARWDGVQWSSFGGGSVNSISAMTQFGFNNSRVIAAGDFQQFNQFDQPAHNIVSWNGLHLSPLGSGANAPVHALKSFNTTLAGQTTFHLVSGGEFTSAGGIAANRIAQWTENANNVITPPAWTAMGSGLNNTVFAIERFNNVIYAAGLFTASGATSLAHIAQFNGTSWVAVGAGLNGTCNALKVYNGQLYAGGSFTTAGGLSSGGLARWNGTTWSVVVGAFGGTVYTLEVFNGDLVMGGTFGGIPGTASPNLAKYNSVTNTYTNLGSGGADSNVHSLLVENGTLYVGGDFTHAGGIAATHLARWDGSVWSSVRGGTDGSVLALVGYNNEVHAGGTFLNVRNGAIPAPCWARYLETGAPWLAVNPQSKSGQCGQEVSFVAGGAVGYSLNYTWHHNGVPLVDGPTGTGSTIAGSRNSVIDIIHIGLGDAGSYDLTLSNACGSGTSTTANLSVTGCCGTADFNCDGDIGTDADIESFFACLAGSCPPFPCPNTADFNADGDIGTDADIESFFRVLGGGSC